MHYGKWKTFHDFLGNYITSSLGGEWGNTELKKPVAERHSILKWYDHDCKLQQENATKLGPVFSSPMTGAASAYYRLAYNLYLIAHNGKDLQTRLLARLRNADNFPGAFFETQVVAWLIKAGFELEFEDESDKSISHCEFTATYQKSNAKLSVEAKSRNPGTDNQGPKRFNIGHQLRVALEKNAANTRLVFLDLNYPISSEKQSERLIKRAEYLLKSAESRLKIGDHPAPPAYVCLTNISDHYFPESHQIHRVAAFYGFKISDFMGRAFPSIRAALRAREKHIEMFDLMQSIEKHSHIPSTFDGELPSVTFSDGQLSCMQIGQVYLVPGPYGQEAPARLTSATIDISSGQMILGYDNGWIGEAPMSQAELDDYKEFPATFFGSHLQQGKQTKTPLELFDFMHESYRNTSKEELLE